jgi:hypothetical protein
MKRAVFTVIGYLILASLFGSTAVRGDETGIDQPGPPIVVDSRGRALGAFFFVPRMSLPDSSVLRKIEGTWYLLPFSTAGFSSTGVQIFYSTANCTGTAYVAAFPHNAVLVPQSTGTVGIANGFLYYAKPGSIKPSSKLTVKSQKLLNFQAKDVGCGQLRSVGPPEFVGEMTTYELSKLGFVPPFKLTEKEQGVPRTHASKSK